MTEDLEGRLRLLLGLNAYEAKVYLALLSKGPKRALEAASISGVPRGRIYDVLRSLEAKGLVGRRDHEYVALDPKQAFSTVSQRVLLDAFEAVRRIEELAESLAGSFKGASLEDEVRLIYGLKESLAVALSSMAGCSGVTYFTAFKSAEKSLDLWGLLEPLVKGFTPKVRIMIPPSIDPHKEIVGQLRARGVEVRKHPAVMVDSMVSCESVIIGLPSSSYDVVSVYVKHREFAESLWRRLDSFWVEGRPLP